MNVYHSIVFMRNSESVEPFRLLLGKGPRAAIEYLAQWDNGGESEHSPTEEKPWGTSDKIVKQGEYILTYNLGLDYIGLVRVERVNKKDFESES